MMRMADDVLVRNILRNFVLSLSKYSCSEGSLLLCSRCLPLTGVKKNYLLSFSSLCKFLNCSFASLVSVKEAVPLIVDQHCVSKVCAYFFLVAVAAHL